MSEKATPASRRATQARATLSAYRRLFATEDGKLVLLDLMNSCFFFAPSVGKDPYETYYNEGLRGAVLRIVRTSKITSTQIEQLAIQLQRDAENMYVD